MPTCIGGMHRSGTSMVAKLLHLCGLYLGQEHDLMPPSWDNPEGFWENVKFVEINEEILNEFGGGWDYPPPMPDGWEGDEALLHLRARAKATLQEFLDHEPWGWKDPRNSLTLPFWRSLVPDLKVVVCLRNPLEVALSLRARNFASYAHGLGLWWAYYQRILQSAPAEERIVTHYDAYFHDSRAELVRVLDFLGMPVSEEVIDGCLSAASTELRHNAFTLRHLLEAGVSPAVLNLYAQLCEEANWIDDGGALQLGLQANDSPSDIGRWLREWNGREGQALSSERRKGAPDEGENTVAEPSSGGGESVARVGRLDRSAVEAELLRREQEALRTELASRESTIRDLREQLEERAAEVRRLRERAEAQEAEIRDLQEQLAAMQSQPERIQQGREASHGAATTIIGSPDYLSFRCNICGQDSVARVEELDREKPSCKGCGSTVRFRSIIHVLSMELFGESLALPDFPTRPDITGIGMSDWDGYAIPLAHKLSYTNTYYHKEPQLDIASGDPALEGTLDFVISSEVFEHIPPPVSRAFENVRKLLKPSGVLIFSVPYGKAHKTVEHFPDLHDYRIIERDGGYVLENTTKDGVVQTFDDLVFHGGPGATLEMRQFSESSLIEEFKAAGFKNVKIYKDPDFDHGIYWRVDWSLPMAVRVS